MTNAEPDFSVEQSKAAQETLGLSNFILRHVKKSPQNVAELSDLFDVHAEFRATGRLLGRASMFALTVVFATLTVKALKRNPSVIGHHCGGCDKVHTHVGKGIARFMKYFDSIVFSTATISWGMHTIDGHQKIDNIENEKLRHRLQKSLHAIEILAIATGLIKGSLAIFNFGNSLLLKNFKLGYRGQGAFGQLLKANHISAHELQGFGALSTFLLCPFDEMLALAIAFVGDALDEYKIRQIWMHDDIHDAPAIIRVHA